MVALILITTVLSSELPTEQRIQPGVDQETWPLPLQDAPPGLFELQFPSSWPPIPTTARGAAILAAEPDIDLAAEIQALPGDSVRYYGNFVGIGRTLSERADRIRKNPSPAVDRTLLALLHDPDTEIGTFRLVHHLMMSRYDAPVCLIATEVAPTKVVSAAEQPRPRPEDRPAVRAFWRVAFGQSEYLGDFVALLDDDAFSFSREPISGRLVGAAEPLGALFLLRTTQHEAYSLLRPLLDDEERFDVAHVLLGLKLTRVTAADPDDTYLGLPLTYDKDSHKWQTEPSAFATVRAWWEARQEATPERFELYDRSFERSAKRWTELRQRAKFADVVPASKIDGSAN